MNRSQINKFYLWSFYNEAESEKIYIDKSCINQLLDNDFIKSSLRTIR